jgi:hypothetical protein
MDLSFPVLTVFYMFGKRHLQPVAAFICIYEIRLSEKHISFIVFSVQPDIVYFFRIKSCKFYPSFSLKFVIWFQSGQIELILNILLKI